MVWKGWGWHALRGLDSAWEIDREREREKERARESERETQIEGGRGRQRENGNSGDNAAHVKEQMFADPSRPGNPSLRKK